MNTNYKFRLTVETPDGQHKTVAFDVDAYTARHMEWEPYDLCSDALTAVAVGGVSKMGAARIDTEREKLAAEVAGKLTSHILNEIKSRDLHNGYEQQG
jgi:hypothetical protein